MSSSSRKNSSQLIRAEKRRLRRQKKKARQGTDPSHSKPTSPSLGSTQASPSERTSSKQVEDARSRLLDPLVDVITEYGGNDFEERLISAVRAHKAGDLELAESTYRDLLESRPFSSVVLRNLGALLRAQGRSEEAVEVFETGVRCEPENATLHLGLGAAFADTGRFDRAVTCFQRVLAIVPDNVPALIGLGRALFRQKKPAEAEPFVCRALTLQPANANALTCAGLVFSALDKNGDLIDVCCRAIAANPDNAVAHHLLGRGLRRQERFEEAVAAFERAITLNPKAEGAYLGILGSLQELGRAEPFEAYLQRAVDLTSNNIEFLLKLCPYLMLRGRYEDVVNICRQVIAMAPEAPQTYRFLGEALMETDRAQALAAFQRYLDFDPDDETIAFFIDILRGEEITAPPSDYVVNLFDFYAPGFDSHLLEELGYSVPRLLWELLVEAVGEERRFQRALDLGCGTGLMGAELRSRAVELHGVDVSKKMVLEAEKKGLYDCLKISDVNSYLLDCDFKYDLITSADVFIYVGDLLDVFRNLSKNCQPGTIFLFSVEDFAGQGYTITTTGRFQHSKSYIDDLSARFGFRCLAYRLATIREEGKGGGAIGGLYALAKMDGADGA